MWVIITGYKLVDGRKLQMDPSTVQFTLRSFRTAVDNSNITIDQMQNMGWYLHAVKFVELYRISVNPRTSKHLSCFQPLDMTWCCVQQQGFDYLKGTCVGQASNPGPWTLQLRNTVSAAKHIESFSFTCDCHVWSETSATKATQDKAIKAMRRQSGHAVFSDFSKCRHEDGLQKPGKAQASGTLVFSKARSQCLSSQWSAPVFQSARIADAVIQVGSIQVRVVAVYGYHSGYADHVTLNDALMGKVFNQVKQFHLPTLVVGDFSCNIYDLTAWDQAVAQGFVDVAARQSDVCGSVPELTYKGLSRLDYVLCNRSAAVAFRALHVDPAGYTDHAILTAEFDWPQSVETTLSWQMPNDFATYSDILSRVKDTATGSIFLASFKEAIVSEDVDVALSVFVQGFEDKVSGIDRAKTSNLMPKKAFGRCSGKLVPSTRNQVVVDKSFGVATDRVLMAHRIRNIQRCREVLYLRQHNRDGLKCNQLWKKIMKSDGFAPNFPEWLLSNDIVDQVPLQCPDAQWFQHVVTALDVELRLWGQAEARQKRIRVGQARGGKIHAAAVKPLSLGTLESLTKSERRRFRLLRTTKGTPANLKILDEKDTPIGATWNFPGGHQQARVTSAQGSLVTLDIPAHIVMAAGSAQQTTWSTDTAYMAEQIRAFWMQHWQTDRKPCMEGVHELLAAVPQLPAFDPWIQPGDIQWILHKLPIGKARGLDGFSMAELRSFGEDECMQLAELFNLILKTGRWPSQLRHAYVALLAKVPFPKTAKDARPITVLPGLYRLFGKIMTQHIFLRTFSGVCREDPLWMLPGKYNVFSKKRCTRERAFQVLHWICRKPISLLTDQSFSC